MNRRGFIRTVTTVISGKVLGLDGIVGKVITNYRYPTSMYGIPYHQSNASMGTWLGITRTTYPQIISTRSYVQSLYLPER